MRLVRAYYRKVIAGILQAPPAMQESIADWVIAVMAADEVASINTSLASTSTRNPESVAREKSIRDAIGNLRAAPTSWAAYKAFTESGVWLGPSRWSVKDFQKMTPEKKVALEERVTKVTKWVEGQLEQDEAQRKKYQDELTARLREAEAFTRSGVAGMGTAQDITQVVPVDLAGWKYWTPEVEKRFSDRIRAEAAAMLADVETGQQHEGLSGTPDPKMVAMFDRMNAALRRRIETGKSDWQTITVRLSRTGGDKFAGMWQENGHLLTLVAPGGFQPYFRERLLQTLRHELQHFAQSYLAHLTNSMFKDWKPGLPGKGLRTPDYSQMMDPKHPSAPMASPAFKEQQKAVYRKLQQQGIDPRGVNFHSLDDIEFYTRLADEVDNFNRLWKQVEKPGDKKVAIRLFTGATPYPSTHARDWHEQAEALGGYYFIRGFEPARFFLSLKQHARPKWQKAVAEFIKAVL